MAPLKIAGALSLSGRSGNTGTEVLEGVRMAIEEAGPQALPVELVISDDQSSAEAARETAHRLAASDVIAVMGPSLSTVALEVDPIYADAGLAVIAPNVTTEERLAMYRLNLGLSRVGDALASYLYRVFDGRRAAVIHSDDGFGRPFALGFRRGAARLDITTTYYPVSGAEQIAAAAHRVADDPERPAVVLGLLETAAIPALRVLKRAEVPGPILGSPSFAYSGYARLFAEEAEERAMPGFFTDGLYAAAAVLFDSGSAAQLAFEQCYWARRGHEPSWRVVLAYDATRVLLDVLATALRQADGGGGLPDTAARRRAVREGLAALNSLARAHAGLSGPVWFDAERMRPAAIRIARFNRDVLESAPLQLTPVLVPDATELASGAVFEVGAGQYKRLQRVVNTGIFINEISRLDLARSSFSADLYLWMCFAHDPRPGADDPTDISFPMLLSGTFDHTRLAAQRTLNDGTEYRLWHVQGEFRNDFDLHRFPFDTQTLSLSFVNTRADMDRIVSVLDKNAAVHARPWTPPPRTPPPTAQPGPRHRCHARAGRISG